MARVQSWGALKKVMRNAARAFAEATHEATTELYVASRKNLTKGIYNKEIPKVKRVRGKDNGKTVTEWRRTGNLRRAESRRIVSEYEGHVYNDAGYALPRHNLGLSPGDARVIQPPPAKKRNTTRIAPWRADAIRQTRRKRQNICRRRLFRALDQEHDSTSRTHRVGNSPAR